jgi:hypothetical protein
MPVRDRPAITGLFFFIFFTLARTPSGAVAKIEYGQVEAHKYARAIS